MFSTAYFIYDPFLCPLDNVRLEFTGVLTGSGILAYQKPGRMLDEWIQPTPINTK
jgi:hypothetical protein